MDAENNMDVNSTSERVFCLLLLAVAPTVLILLVTTALLLALRFLFAFVL